jgi:hypothetical protein
MDTEKIIMLLLRGFRKSQFERLCTVNEKFSDVRDDLPERTSISEYVNIIFTYAQANECVEDLLAWAKKENPNKYERYSPYYEVAKIRHQLKQLPNEDIYILTYDYFRLVYKQLTPNSTSDQLIERLLKYAEEKDELGKLYRLVERRLDKIK